MKHPVLDRILILICALGALLYAAGFVMILGGWLSVDQIAGAVASLDPSNSQCRVIMIISVIILVVFAILLINVILPEKQKRSSNFAIQQNENGTVRISIRALETLVQKVLEGHGELKVVTSSIFSDEQTVRVDLHVTLESDISMPLAISALQKQIKKYLESCSGVMVQEVRVYVDNTMPSTEETQNSPYAIPSSLLWRDQGQLPKAEEAEDAEYVPAETPAEDTADMKTVVPDGEQSDVADGGKTENEGAADLQGTPAEADVQDGKPAEAPVDGTAYVQAEQLKDDVSGQAPEDADGSQECAGNRPDEKAPLFMNTDSEKHTDNYSNKY